MSTTGSMERLAGAPAPAAHQVNDELLAAYAAGSLPEAFSAVIAAQASICPETRRRLRELELIGGALLELEGGKAMRLGSFEATLAKIAAQDADEPLEAGHGTVIDTVSAPERPLSGTGRPQDILPKPIRDYVGGGLADVAWRPLGMGAKQSILYENGAARLRLLHIPAGCELPDHGHRGMEMTLVLQGAFIDGDQRFARGDLDIADEETEHRPIADVSEDCVCLVACEGRLKFSSLLPRIAQPFLRI